MSSSSSSIEYIVLGAGVVGLTTALELALRLRHQSTATSKQSPTIAVVARHFPSDRPLDVGIPNTIIPQSAPADAVSADLAGSFYCSPFAGANWNSFVASPSLQGGLGYYEAVTYSVWRELLSTSQKESTSPAPEAISRTVNALKSSLAKSSLCQRDLRAQYTRKGAGLKSLGVFDPEFDPDEAKLAGLTANQLAEQIWFNDLVGNIDLTFPATESISDGSADTRLSLQFPSFILSPPHYLAWLVAQLEATGWVTFQQLTAPAQSLAEVHSLYPSAHTLFNCSGLGARGLDDVKDLLVYPVRGDTIAVIPTKSEYSRVIQARNLPMEIQTDTRTEGDVMYVFPRGTPAPSSLSQLSTTSSATEAFNACEIGADSEAGDSAVVDVQQTIILGGSRKLNIWHTHPDPHMESEIIGRVSKTRAEFKSLTVSTSPNSSRPASVATVGGAMIRANRRRASSLSGERFTVLPRCLGGGAGLRPCREGGNRIEAERKQFPSSSKLTPSTVTVIHNYGSGSAGFQMSWGMAIESVDLAAVGKSVDGKRTVEEVTKWALERGRKERLQKETRL